MIEIRKGQAPAPVGRDEFSARFHASFIAEVRNVALALVKTVIELRSGRLQAVQPKLARPRPK